MLRRGLSLAFNTIQLYLSDPAPLMVFILMPLGLICARRRRRAGRTGHDGDVLARAISRERRNAGCTPHLRCCTLRASFSVAIRLTAPSSLMRATTSAPTVGSSIMGWAQTYAAHLSGSEIHDHGPLELDSLPEQEFPNLRRVLKEAPEGNPFAVEFEMGLDALLKGFMGWREAAAN